ncbi:MMR_HSR1 domain-containing protein [Cucumis melo var. makuwa]|uniref:MMR_HSR1 domain-containing protein n=1 Tax=Cucumis melo var. makuwa TaxID=1194695 RepID=A0A5D3CJY8_CUCMM|nr:MMR_HSR1 domain-containing protein [Cucumis melo var. makuwa]TYK11622.1 MMR_HSR1 domain-containing protein [Cucumis melo var. makuwa]
METEDDQMNVENGCIIGEFDEIEYEYSSAALDVDICRRRINRVHREILESYDQLRTRSENLKQAKQKILSYSPGAWIEQVGGMKLSDYDIPQTISLILIGPKGSGKSSLINRISKVFEEDHFAPERAQVSCNSSGEGGTFFLHEYMILRKSKSFCLYDTRGLSDDPSDNIETLKQWMSKGVRHGELVTRKSDASNFINRMKCKARQSFPRSRVIRIINFVIFVVDGLSVLKSIDGDDKQKDYDRVITTAFNCPYLSYGDDKPVVVLTHGDLLSFADRVRVRGHLGNLLGIPSTKQIFDIPDRYDPVTELTIIDMLHYCLEHADKNLPHKRWMVIKDMFSVSAADIYFVAIMMIVFISASLYQVYVHRCLEQQKPKNVEEIVWHEIRHLWLDE